MVVLFGPKTFDGVEPIELPKRRQLNRLDLDRGPVRLVGYGMDPEFGDGAPAFLVEGFEVASDCRGVIQGQRLDTRSERRFLALPAVSQAQGSRERAPRPWPRARPSPALGELERIDGKRR